MKKYFVVSPTFGDFRAGEPKAFEVAQQWLDRFGNSNEIPETFEGYHVNHRDGIISVTKDNDRPFTFIVVGDEI